MTEEVYQELPLKAVVFMIYEDEIERLNCCIVKLEAAINWIEPPFIDETTSEEELRNRIKFCVSDARAALAGEKKDE
jgi:hypothetical protein